MNDLTLPAPAASPQRLRQVFALRDLGVAPENLRADEPPDEDIPQLAETILAAGVLQLLTVRPGRGRKEKPGMALDGRRRLLALWSLLDAGRIADDYPVEAFVETDPARQAAAVLLTNTALPVHIADVIGAIGKMLKAKLAPAAIAAALGYAELEVRRLAALSGLHARALKALKLGKITLRQAKLLARLPDRKAQGDIVETALKGFGFQEWRITEQLDAGRVTARDPRFGLVGADRYAAAGGRTETDLFGERAAVLLDPEILQQQWVERATGIAAALAATDRDIQVTPDSALDTDIELEPFGYAYGVDLDAAALEAWRAAKAAADAAKAGLSGCDFAAPEAGGAIAAFLTAKVAAEQASEPSRAVTLVQVTPSAATGLDVRCYSPPAPELPDEDDGDEADRGRAAIELGGSFAATPAPGEPLAPASAPQVSGVNHALHEVRTDVATRALIRALADDPGAALAALVARLFSVMVLRTGLAKGGGALSVAVEAYGRPRAAPIAALDGDVRRRLADRRAAWEASGLSSIAWVAGLAHGERMGLLAELVALSLDLREERTTSLRRAARTEATEIAALCGADVTLHWTPDEAFLAAHPKSQLLAMLGEMGAPDSKAGGCKKDELVGLVAQRAAEHGWAPAYLSWTAAPPVCEEPEAKEPQDAPPEEPPPHPPEEGRAEQAPGPI